MDPAQFPKEEGTSACLCRHCGSNHVSRSTRRGLKEGMLFRVAFLVPYRCWDCGRRFLVFQAFSAPSATRHQTLAGYLGVREPKSRRRFHHWLVVIVALIAIFALSGPLGRLWSQMVDFWGELTD